VTYGTIGFGFFRDTEQFRRKVLYWHIIPSCTELGYQCPGKSGDESIQAFTDGIQIQNQMAFAALAQEVIKGRSP